MGFSLRHLQPHNFQVNKHSEVWNTELDFKTGESTLITAASGRGKSSLFRIMTGLSDDYSGDVYYHEKAIGNLSADEISALRKNEWSLIFQSLALFPHISAEQNIRITSKGQLNQVAVQKLGMESVLSKVTARLSYGERQRIAIIRALSRSFRFLIMDEPFSHLDTALREQAWKLIVDECQKNDAGMILLDLQALPFIQTDRSLAL